MTLATGLAFAERPYTGEVAPTTFEDRSRNNIAMTITGPTSARLPSGLWYLEYDGDNDKVTGSAARLPLGNLPRTVLVWVNPVSVTDDAVIGYGNNAVNQTWAVHLGSGFLALQCWGPAWQTDDVAVVVNTWQLLAVSYAGAGIPDFSVNAVAFAASTSGGAPAPNTPATNGLILGERIDNLKDYEGGMALPKILFGALSIREIEDILEKERPFFGV